MEESGCKVMIYLLIPQMIKIILKLLAISEQQLAFYFFYVSTKKIIS